MLITCEIKETLVNGFDPEEKEFIINTPGNFCPTIGMRIEREGSMFMVRDTIYSDDTGMVILYVSQESFGNNPEIEALMVYKKKGSKLEAVKFIKENRGCGLKDAKDYVDKVWDQLS